MSEEEIIVYLKNCLNDEFNFKHATRQKDKMAIQGLLDLYQKEREKNKKLEKCLDEDLGNIINLGILLSEHAEKPKDKNIYVDEAQVFLNTLDYYYIPKSKVREKIEELKEDEDFYREQDRIYEYEGKINLLESLLEKGDK